MKSARVLIPAVFLIGLSAYLSFNLAGEWPEAATPGQRLSTIAEAGYCLFGLLAGAAALWKPVLLRRLLTAWVFFVTAAAGLASMTWGGQSWTIGIVSALAGGAVALLIAWWLMVGSRPPKAPSAEP